MTVAALQFPYVARDPSLGNASLAPMLPLTLTNSQSVTTAGLVDSGAAINVLPFSLGEQSVSVILGQVNFFMEFDVCFFRSRDIFEARPKS